MSAINSQANVILNDQMLHTRIHTSDENDIK